MGDTFLTTNRVEESHGLILVDRKETTLDLALPSRNIPERLVWPEGNVNVRSTVKQEPRQAPTRANARP